MRAKPSACGRVLAVERQIDAVAGRGAERVRVDPGQRLSRARTRVVDERLGEAGEPQRRRRDDRALQMRVARHRQRLARGAIEARLRDRAARRDRASPSFAFSQSRVATRI